MSTPVNTHEIEGSVNAKFGPFPIGEKGMNKNYLFVDCAYMIRGKVQTQTVKALCFSWADNASKISKVLPGDVVKFAFSISGKVNPDKKDFLGVPGLWNEILIEGDVEILNTSQRRLYNNGIDSPKDDLGTFPMPNTSPISQVDIPEKKLDYEDPETGLPF